MKKCILVAGLVFTLTMAALLVTYLHINSQQNQVEIKETTLLGDAREAAGTELKFKVFNDELLWDIDYEVLSQKAPEVHFKWVTPNVYSSDPVTESSAGFSTDFFGGLGSDGSIESMISATAKPVVYEVAKRTKSGETHEETIQLKEFCNYYPGNFEIESNGVYISQADSPDSYFKIPIPEDYPLKVSITKNSQGEISEYLINPIYSNLEPAARSTFTTSACYVALNPPIYSLAETDHVEKVPLPDDMRGIHFIPLLSFGNADKWFKPDLKNAKLVYGLPAGCEILGLQKSNDQKKLYLFTKENQKASLSIIDIHSMECIQRLTLPAKVSDAELTVLKENDRNILAVFSTGQFYLFTQKGKQMEIALSENLYQVDELKGVQLSASSLDFDYDGNRFAMAFYNQYIDAYPSSGCSSYLVLCGKNGLQYVGYYANNLNPKRINTESGYVVAPAISCKVNANTQKLTHGIKVKL